MHLLVSFISVSICSPFATAYMRARVLFELQLRRPFFQKLLLEPSFFFFALVLPWHDMNLPAYNSHVPTPFVSFIAMLSTNERFAQTNWEKSSGTMNETRTKTYFLKWFYRHFFFLIFRAHGHKRIRKKSQFHLSRTFHGVYRESNDWWSCIIPAQCHYNPIKC